MRKIFYLIILSVVFYSLLIFSADNESISVSPSQIFVGTRINFGINNYDSSAGHNPQWDFGDGSAKKNGDSVTYFYKEPGTYTVKVTLHGGGPPREITQPVQVEDCRSVRAAGSNFFTGMEVPFETLNFVKNQLKWDFGDGVIKNSGRKEEKHIYINPGHYMVKVYDFNGNSTTAITCDVSITPDNRGLALVTSPAKAYQEVEFRANNFPRANLKWDFGDMIVENGSHHMKHTYTRAGNFTVKVKDLGDQSLPEVTLVINVQPDDRTVTFTPANPSLYTEITFEARNFPVGSLEWDFGDLIKISGGTTVKHRYSRMGRYVVKVKQQGSEYQPLEKELNISQDLRRIEILPSAITVGQTANIKLTYSDVTQVEWHIGSDEVLRNSPLSIQHRFKDPGTVEIECVIPDQTPVRSRIAVRDNRQVSISPRNVFAGSELTAETRYFNSQRLKWDFGDGIVKQGSPREKHIYQKPGWYNLKIYDFDGQAKIPVEKRINISSDNRSIETTSQLIYQGAEVGVMAKNFLDRNVEWNFGDGNQQKGSINVTHVYRRTGNFTIVAVDFAGRDTKKISKNIRVQSENRKVNLPAEIIAGEAYNLNMQNVSGGDFVWEFNGRDQESGPELRSKTFKSPGIQTLTIRDRSGKYPPFSQQFKVVADKRALKITPPAGLPNETFKMYAHNFRGNAVSWNFGDGSTIASAQKSVHHQYASIGKYKVTAIDFAGNSSKTFSQDITVSELSPNFEITMIELAFNNGKYYKIIPKKSMSPSYYLKMKVRGRGLIRGEWFLDDMSLGPFSVVSRENQTVLLKGSRVVKLPITNLGMHVFTFKLNNYEFSKPIPILRYFVASSGAIGIKAPLSGAKIKKKDSIRLQWFLKKKNPRYEIAISEIPFQFLKDAQINWQRIGKKSEYTLKLRRFQSGTWIYWQVRDTTGSGQVLTTSDIATFKLID